MDWTLAANFANELLSQDTAGLRPQAGPILPRMGDVTLGPVSGPTISLGARKENWMAYAGLGVGLFLLIALLIKKRA